MRLKEFAEQHSLRVRRSHDDDTDNIVGKYGKSTSTTTTLSVSC
jgi:hypothetical protein